jgi:uncharacterized protein
LAGLGGSLSVVEGIMNRSQKEVREGDGDLGLSIPYQSLSPEALRGIVEEFISREGTDYGTECFSFEQKYQEVIALIKSGKATIAFDSETETVSITPFLP